MYFTSKHHIKTSQIETTCHLHKNNFFGVNFTYCFMILTLILLKFCDIYKCVMQSMWSFPKTKKTKKCERTHELINMNHIMSSHIFYMLSLVTKLDPQNSYPYTIWALCWLCAINDNQIFFSLKCFHMVFNNSSLFMLMSNLI